MQKTADSASSHHIEETLRVILGLDYVQEAKILLLALVVSGKTTAHITDIADIMNAPIVDVDFGRVALTAEKANKSKSFDFVQLDEDWIKKYVPCWFDSIVSKRVNESDVQSNSTESDSPDIGADDGN